MASRAADKIRHAATLLRMAVAAVETIDPAAAVDLAPLFADCARVAEAATLRCARRAGDHGARRYAGERSAASLLSSVAKTSLGKAKAGLDTAEKLRAAPAVEQALWRGELSFEQAAALAPAAATAPEAAADLLRTASTASVKELKEAVARTLRDRRDEAAVVEAERRIHLRRYCRTWLEDGGAVRLEALLAPKDGARVVAALGRETEQLGRGWRRVGRDVAIDQVRADALAILVAGPASGGRTGMGRSSLPGGGSRAGSSEAGGSGAGSGGVGADLGSSGAGGAGPVGPAASEGVSRSGAGGGVCVPQVLVRVDAAALRRGSVSTGEICEIAGVGPVSVGVARELLCEGFLTLLVTDGADIRTVTSTTRSVPSRIEKALLLRDASCVVPGCGATERLEIDHWKTDFAWRGPTELANLCRLCPAHHAMKTRTGWQLVGCPGRWRWFPPKSVSELARRHGTIAPNAINSGRGAAAGTGARLVPQRRARRVSQRGRDPSGP